MKGRLKYLYLFLIAVTIFLWALDEEFKFNGPIIQYLGQIMGLMGILAMSLDFITSIRIKFLEDFAGGLNNVYFFHGYIGKLAGMFILVHPIFLLFVRFAGIDTVLHYFFPQNSTFFNYGILSFYSLLILIILTVFARLPYNLWKWTHRLMIVAFVLGALHIWTTYTGTRSPGISLKEAWIFAFIVLALLSWVYRDLIYPYFLAKMYKVVKVNHLGLITEVYMEPVGAPMKFTAGQYLFMSVTDNKELGGEAHPFGFTSSPHDKTIRVSIKQLGDYTKKIGEVLKPGNHVKLWGPYGEFNWDHFNQYDNQVWIAGGIGVAPFLSMAKYAIESKTTKKITMFYVEKNAGECEYNDELDKLITKDGPIKLIHHYDDDGGFLTADLVHRKVVGLGKTAILLCGPEVMVVNLEKQFRALGIKDSMMKTEVFGMKKTYKSVLKALDGYLSYP